MGKVALVVQRQPRRQGLTHQHGFPCRFKQGVGGDIRFAGHLKGQRWSTLQGRGSFPCVTAEEILPFVHLAVHGSQGF